MFNNMLIASKYENMKHDSLQQEVAIGTIYAVTPFICDEEKSLFANDWTLWWMKVVEIL